jgi:hypothetical protein
MGIKYRNHHMISAINHRPNTDTCPLSNIFKGNCIAIVTSPIQKNSQLDGNRELRIVGLVLEDGMTRYVIKDIIKDLRVNTEFLPKQVRAMFFMMDQHMKLRCPWRFIRLVQYMSPFNLITKSKDGVKKAVVGQRDIIRRDRAIARRIRSPCHRGEGERGGRGAERQIDCAIAV